MRLNKEDVLNALIVDPVADQIIRARELGYTMGEIGGALDWAREHAAAELKELKGKEVAQ